MSYSMQRYASPIGELYLVAKDAKLRGVIYPTMWKARFERQFSPCVELETPVLKEAKRQLAEYFAGHRQAFDLPLELGGTLFQNKVWSALLTIGFGETRTYKQQAVSIAAPTATRAVGRANGLNPISIVVPCHRVIGSSGALTGYGGGVEAKEFLLKLEATR